MTDFMEQSPLLSLRFLGENLDSAAIPIQHLGVSLLALQRIVNKAYLSERGRLQSAQQLTHRERSEISLQITSHKTGSDLYEFSAFLLNPVSLGVLANLVTEVLKALARYASEGSGSSVENESEQEQNLFIVIYRDVVYLTRPLGSFGGIEAVEIFPGAEIKMKSVRFDVKSRKRVHELKGEAVQGRLQELSGQVVRLYPPRNVVLLARNGGPDVSVFTDQKLFEFVRYSCGRNDVLTFTGWPVFPLGIERLSFKKFHAKEMHDCRTE